MKKLLQKNYEIGLISENAHFNLKNIKNFHDEYNMGEIYNEYLDCNKNKCAKSKQIFNTNLYRYRKVRINKEKKQNLEDIKNFGTQADLFLLNN